MYAWIKEFHVAAVTFNIVFFALRFYWMLVKSRFAGKPWVRRLSVANDSLLLAAGISLAVLSQQYPVAASWLTAKLLGLLCYIVFGSLALKRARSMRHRIYFGILSLLTAAYILLVALTRTPTPWILL